MKYEPFTEKRPWGDFRQFSSEEQCTVKIITVNRNQKLSLQSHNNRDEFWVILDEGLRITIGDKTYTPKPGEEFTIPRNTKHRIESVEKQARVLEIVKGSFDENDIIRYEDDYGRTTQ